MLKTNISATISKYKLFLDYNTSNKKTYHSQKTRMNFTSKIIDLAKYVFLT